MQPFLVIQCLTEHVDTVLSYCVYVQKEVKQFKYYSQILLFNHTHLKPHLDTVFLFKDQDVSNEYFDRMINGKVQAKINAIEKELIRYR